MPNSIWLKFQYHVQTLTSVSPTPNTEIKIIKTEKPGRSKLLIPIVMADSTPTGFLDIPLELRRQIYQYCLVRPSLLTVNYLWNDIVPEDTFGRYQKSLLLMCRQISEEALDVLYGGNNFRVDLNPGGGIYLEKNFTETNRKRSM